MMGSPNPFLPQATYNPATSILAGMSQAQLQAALSTAQQTLIALQSGQKVVTVSYAQGDGSRSVTYNQASLSGLTMLIQQLQRQLGIPGVRRRALRPVF